jgi:oligopeptide transport system permease protein
MGKIAKASLAFLILITALSALAPWLTPYSYEEQDIAHRLEGPTQAHWFGTDALGRDLLSRVLYGGRMSLAVGVFTALFALLMGTLTGAISGWCGGWVDRALMRVVDFFYIFPALLIAILLTVFLGRGFGGIFVAIALTSWVSQARLVRGLVLQACGQPYVEAAQALGLRASRILLRHILPNIAGPVIVSLSFQIPTNILAESFLSFIGLGLQPPYSSWGTLANEGFRAIQSYPHLILYPGGALFLTALAFNYLGDALRDVLDPHQSWV